jgi:hypothetical protein
MLQPTSSLNENDVVAAVRKELTQRGWSITSWATTKQTGVDVLACLGRRRIHVEAKGLTSTMTGSKRFGMAMDSGQLKIQVGMALWKTAELRSLNPDDEVAIALPDEERVRERIRRIEPVLMASRIGVLFVNAQHTVAPWNVRI